MENTYLPIILSSRLRDILMKINDNVSKFLLSLEDNNDYSFSFSFLDITEDESTISFLQGNKYNELPKERGNGDLAWSCSARNEVRAGRLLNKIAPCYKANEIEKWVNAFKAEFKNAQKNIRFKVIDGNDIVKYYNGKRYSRGNGSLNKSCMRHDQCAEWMELYTKNKENIKMLILLENKDLIAGRALLWKLDEPKDTWFLDRIYVKEDSDAILFKKHAEKNGWLYKPQQTFDCTKIVQNGQEVNITMKAHVKGDYNYFPYIDTLHYFNKKDFYLTNNDEEYLSIPHMIKLREINGGHSGNENFVFDVINKEFISIEDSMFCYYGDGYTHKNNAFFIKEYDEYVFPSELRYSTFHKRFISSQSTSYSYSVGSFLMDNEIYRVYLSKDKKLYDNFLRKDLDKVYTRCAGAYFHLDLLIKGIDGEYYFKDEYDEAKVLAQKEIEKKAVEELMKSSAYIREMMGIKEEEKKEKKKKKLWGISAA